MWKKIKLIVIKILRGTEKCTKTDMVYLAQGGFWLTVAQIISAASGFILAIAFANLLPKETYGTYKYILSVLSILTIPTLAGINTAVLRAAARNEDGTLKLALKTRISWGILSALGCLIVAGYYYWQNNNVLMFVFLIAGLFLPFMDSVTVFDAYLQGKKRFDKTTKYNAVIKILATLAMLISLFFTHNIFLILLNYLFFYTFGRVFFLLVTFKKYVGNNVIDVTAINYGKHLTIISVLANLVTQLDGLLMWHYLDATALAIYAMALAPVNQLRSLFKSVVTISMPKISEQNKEIIKKTLPLKIIKAILILIIPIVIFVILMPYIYKIFFPQYLESVRYAQYLTLVLILFPERFLSIGTLLHAEKKLVYLTNILNPLLKAIWLFILLPIYGITGAILATVAHQIVFIFIDYYYFKKI
ncbi:MAG TPA: oligosaccharide flippase family protein [bacterium]|nr:oligosaccharide flippase family protein [bacterium]